MQKGDNMRRAWYGGLFICMCCLTLGMGTMGGQSSIKTPEPDVNYMITLVDQADVSMELEKFSCEGLTYLTGQLGKADLSIDFEKIRSILFVVADDTAKALVTLDNHQQVELDVEKNTPCYGVSTFAEVRIEIKDIKKIVLHGKKPIVE